jgi:hypothetical protein
VLIRELLLSRRHGRQLIMADVGVELEGSNIPERLIKSMVAESKRYYQDVVSIQGFLSCYWIGSAVEGWVPGVELAGARWPCGQE